MGTTLLICGYLFIAIAVIFVITILIRIIKKEGFTPRDKSLPVIIVGIGFLYIIALAFQYSQEIGLSDKIQILLMFGLVAVTTFYAWSASKQADASAKMARSVVQPRLIPNVRLVGSFDENRCVRVIGEVSNDGNGPAYDLEFCIMDDSQPPQKLLVGESKVPVLRAHVGPTPWNVTNDRLHFPESAKNQRRIFIIKYRDLWGECEIHQPFVLKTDQNGNPKAELETLFKKILKKQNLEQELP